MSNRKQPGDSSMPMRAPRSLWAHYPWFATAAMLLVFAVNVLFIVDAVQSFPGAAGDDGFDLSNSYDRVLEAAAAQRALGWDIAVSPDAARPLLHLAAADGQPLADAAVSATATRPLGPPETVEVAFVAVAPGRYLATVPLPSGQWDLALRIGAAGHEVRVTRRVVIP